MYKEVTKFKTPQKESEECTSQKFKEAIGVNFCVQVKRPVLEPLNELLKPVSLEKSFNKYHSHFGFDDVSGEDNESSEIKRPFIILSGPYEFEVNLFLMLSLFN